MVSKSAFTGVITDVLRLSTNNCYYNLCNKGVVTLERVVFSQVI
jgi:hypothetical protein